MIRLLFISLLFVSCTGNTTQKANKEMVSYQKQVEGIKPDSLLIGIQNKIKTAFAQSLRLKNDKSLIELNKELTELSIINEQSIISYWQAYLQFYSSIYYLTNDDKKASEKEVDKGIDYLKNIKNKNSEEYALLAMLQGYSIQFKGMQAMFIGPKATKNAKTAITLDSTNLRAYFVYGSNDFYTPTQYGGGKEAEKYLLKAMSLPTQKEESDIIPSWGKEEAYELLIRLYIKKENWDLAKKYFHEGITEFPDSYIINQLKSELHINNYPFKVTIIGKGKPIILIPGLSCSGDVWNQTVDSLKNNYQCHILTLAGFSNQKPINIDKGYLPIIQKKISEYIENEMEEKPILIGHSLGGFLALSIASSKPNSLKSIVIVDSYPFLSLIFNPNATEKSIIPQANQMKNNIISIADSLYINQQRLMLKTMITDSLNVEKVLKWSLESDRKTTAQAMYEIMCNDLRDELHKIKVPIFVFGSWYGYKDYGVTKESVYSNLKNQYSEAENCTIKVADKSKHFIMLDEPVWFITELKIFLKIK